MSHFGQFITARIAAALLAFPHLLFAASLDTEDGNHWPAAPPNCWSVSRVVHGVADYETMWAEHVSIETTNRRPLRAGKMSPNGGYEFSFENSEKTRSIRVDAEAATQRLIHFTDSLALGPINWVNEKLIAGRVWWGRIAATDFIFDVEAGQFIWHESATESDTAMQQYREGCKQFGRCDACREPATEKAP